MAYMAGGPDADPLRPCCASGKAVMFIIVDSVPAVQFDLRDLVVSAARISCAPTFYDRGPESIKLE